MIKIEFLGPINIEPIFIDVTNLYEVSEVLQKDKKLSEWLEISAVAINNSLTNKLDIELKDGDVISILPPVCGG